MINEVIGIVRKALIAHSGVTSYVALRVYPTHLAVKNMSKNPITEQDFPCITIHYQGSKKDNSRKFDGIYRFQLCCWSNTDQATALLVQEQVVDCFFAQRLDDTEWHIDIFEDVDSGIQSIKTDAGVRHWTKVFYKIEVQSRLNFT